MSTAPEPDGGCQVKSTAEDTLVGAEGSAPNEVLPVGSDDTLDALLQLMDPVGNLADYCPQYGHAASLRATTKEPPKRERNEKKDSNQKKPKGDPGLASAVDKASLETTTRVQNNEKKRGKYKCGRCGKEKENHICQFDEKKIKFDAWTQTQSLFCEEGASGSKAPFGRFKPIKGLVGASVSYYSHHPSPTRGHVWTLSESIAHALWTLLKLSKEVCNGQCGTRSSTPSDEEGNNNQEEIMVDDQYDEEGAGENILEV